MCDNKYLRSYAARQYGTQGAYMLTESEVYKQLGGTRSTFSLSAGHAYCLQAHTAIGRSCQLEI